MATLISHTQHRPARVELRKYDRLRLAVGLAAPLLVVLAYVIR